MSPESTDPNADLADIRQHWLRFCSHDTDVDVDFPFDIRISGERMTVTGPYPCICPTEDHRPVIAALVTEVETLRAEVARLGVPSGASAAAILLGEVKGWMKVWDELQRNLGRHLGMPDATVPELVDTIPHVMAERAQLRADVAQLTADRDSLIKAGEALAADRDEARTKLARCREDRDEYGGQAAAAEKDAEQLGRRLAEVLSERDEAQALLRLAPHHQQQVETLEYELVQARAEVTRQRSRAQGEIDAHRLTLGRLIEVGQSETLHQARREDAEDERDALRPVVEALLPLIAASKASTAPITPAYQAVIDAADRYLVAVDQMAPSTPPSTPESDVQGEVAVTDAVEAPGGTEGEPSRMDCAERCEVPAGVRILESPPSRHAWSDVVRCPNDGCEKTFLVIRNERTDA